MFVSLAITSAAQEVETIFKRSNPSSGGYAAISNKFTTIRGEYANMVEVYGGWFIDKRVLIGIGAAATTNDIRVPEQFSTFPGRAMTYQYGQAGLMTEYVIASNRVIHMSFQVFAGSGFTLQYDRNGWHRDDYFDRHDYEHDVNWFFVVEPGVKVEMNLFRWLRFAPGVSYRFTEGSNGMGLADADLRGVSVNLTLKVGKF